MKYQFIALILSGALIFSYCKKGGTEAVTKHGYKYQLFETGSGNKIQPGDVTYLAAQLIHVQRDGKDSVFLDTSNPMPFEFVMPFDSQVTTPSPIVDILPYMRKGDSVVVMQPIDSLKNLEPFMKSWKFIKHSFKVLDIINDKDRKVVQDKEAAVAAQVEKDIKAFNDNSLKDMETTPSGVKILFHEKGTGPLPKQGEAVKVLYYGVTRKDGKLFDSAYKKGSPFIFPIGEGQVIKGWEEGMALLPKGSKATLFLPAEVAYGEKGVPTFIEPNSDLVFYVEVIK